MILDEVNENRDIEIRKMIGAKHIDLFGVWLVMVFNFYAQENGRKENIRPKLHQFTGIFFPLYPLAKHINERIQQQENRKKPKSSPNGINQMKGIEDPNSIFFHCELL